MQVLLFCDGLTLLSFMSEGRGGNRNVQPLPPAAAATAAAWPSALAATQARSTNPAQVPSSMAVPPSQPFGIPMASNIASTTHPAAISNSMAARPGGSTQLGPRPAASTLQQQGGSMATASLNPTIDRFAPSAQANHALSMPAASASQQWPNGASNSSQSAFQGMNASHRYHRPNHHQQENSQGARHDESDARPGRESHLQKRSDSREGLGPSFSARSHIRQQVSNPMYTIFAGHRADLMHLQQTGHTICEALTSSRV